jgi:hypothetical protein
MTLKKLRTSQSATEKPTGARGSYSHSKPTTIPAEKADTNTLSSLPDWTTSIRADTSNWDNRLLEFFAKVAWALGSTWGLPYQLGTLTRYLVEQQPDWETLALDFHEQYEKALNQPALYDPESGSWYRSGFKLPEIG